MSVALFYEPACRDFFLMCAQARARALDVPADRLRMHIQQRIDAVLAQFKLQSFLSEKLALIEYALVASADEAVLSVPDALSEQWLLKPLQLERFNEYHAGSGFFVRLAALRKAERPDETVLHLYWLCLQHGFFGELILKSSLEREHFMSDFYKTLITAPEFSEQGFSPVRRFAFSRSDFKTLLAVFLALVSFCLAVAFY